jgi:hypothetical protein
LFVGYKKAVVDAYGRRFSGGKEVITLPCGQRVCPFGHTSPVIFSSIIRERERERERENGNSSWELAAKQRGSCSCKTVYLFKRPDASVF